jgi:hypothetical protein
MTNLSRPKTICRQIENSDLDGIASLLVEGFAGSTKQFWAGALKKLGEHQVPEGFPRFGYMLESSSVPVGVLLVICTRFGGDGSTRCNVSSWYAQPAFRSFAPILVSKAMKHQPATFLNVSPARHTWPIIEAQGFHRFCSGTFVAIPALMPPAAKVRIREFNWDREASHRLAPHDLALLSDHRAYGCLCLICETPDGVYPLVFRRRQIKRGMFPAAQLIYSPSLDALKAVAGPLGRYLLRRGMPLLLVGATGPMPLIGKYAHDKWPMYFRGKHRPWAGDIAYTEAALFGV